MARKEDKFLSIRILRILMKTVGFWTADNKAEERLLTGLLCYTICTMTFSLWVEAYEFYFSMGDFYAITYTACSVMPVTIILLKIYFFLRNRKELQQMLKYTQNNFWYTNYDEHGKRLLEDTDKRGVILMLSFTFFVHGTAVTYVMTPIIENRGRNTSDRILPFKIWGGIATDVSPNFEIMFFMEILAVIHTDLCFCSFDNLLGILNIQAAAQFKILQHRLQTVTKRFEMAGTEKTLDAKEKDEIFEEFKKCVKFHHELIWYSEKMEGIFMYTTLCQLLVSSIMLCVAGFQVFLAQGTLIRRMIFIAHTNGCFFQVFLITVTANELTIESRAVGDAAYNANWQLLSHEDNKGIRNLILMIIVRSARACCISAGGFFPVSLETFTAVLSTAASYFTLLRNFAVEQTVE